MAKKPKKEKMKMPLREAEARKQVQMLKEVRNATIVVKVRQGGSYGIYTTIQVGWSVDFNVYSFALIENPGNWPLDKINDKIEDAKKKISKARDIYIRVLMVAIDQNLD